MVTRETDMANLKSFYLIFIPSFIMPMIPVPTDSSSRYGTVPTYLCLYNYDNVGARVKCQNILLNLARIVAYNVK